MSLIEEFITEHPEKVLLVTKGHSVEIIAKFLEQHPGFHDKKGYRHLGESYVQEMLAKKKDLESEFKIKWHFIGHLQTNKIRSLLEHFGSSLYLIETVDREALASKLQEECSKLGITLCILLQVNISREPTKSGVLIEELPDLVEFCKSKCPSIIVKGLMAVGEQGNADQMRQMQDLRDSFNPDWELSLGMSADWHMAINLFGATQARIGTALLGERE